MNIDNNILRFHYLNIDLVILIIKHDVYYIIINYQIINYQFIKHDVYYIIINFSLRNFLM